MYINSSINHKTILKDLPKMEKLQNRHCRTVP